jgi:hypothetical protein
MSNWDTNIQEVRDSIILLKKDLEAVEAKDRLDAVSRIIQCIDFMRQSNIGWVQFLEPRARQPARRGSSEGYLLEIQEDVDREDRQRCRLHQPLHVQPDS